MHHITVSIIFMTQLYIRIYTFIKEALLGCNSCHRQLFASFFLNRVIEVAVVRVLQCDM